MNKSSKIYIAGHTGMVGSAIHRRLVEEGYTNYVLRTIDELDLTRQKEVEDFFEKERPEYVFLAAAKVGGIQANNTYRAQFIYENLMIQNNIIHNSYVYGVKKLLFLSSSCVYPKNAPQPLKEEYLLTGELEPTNEPYAIAKIAGIKMCENYYRQYRCNFFSVMPTNLYGPNDNYNLETSHVLPAILRKMHLAHCLETSNWDGIRHDLSKRPIDGFNGTAKEQEILTILKKYCIQYSVPETINLELGTLNIEPEPERSGARRSQTLNLEPVTVTLWGSGQVYREFMHVDDMAAACIKIMEAPETLNFEPGTWNLKPGTFLNIGTGLDHTIEELALIIKKVVGFQGELKFDHTHADGTCKKLLDISRLQELGFKPLYTLEDGVEKVYQLYTKA